MKDEKGFWSSFLCLFFWYLIFANVGEAFLCLFPVEFPLQETWEVARVYHCRCGKLSLISSGGKVDKWRKCNQTKLWKTLPINGHPFPQLSL
jgi:hypothetical protein